MEYHHILPVGSMEWFWGLLITFLSIILILIATHLANSNNKEKIRWTLFSVLLFWFVGFFIYSMYEGSFSLQTSLPLHVCSMCYWIGLITMYSKDQKLFEFLSFLGIAGGIHSILTPEFVHGYDPFYHIQYYFEHGGIVVMPIFLGVAYDMKPRRWSWLRVLIPVNVLAILMYLLNLVLGSNYMFVNSKPVADNPLLVGEWPFYIFVLEFVFVVHTYIIYLFFHKFRKWY